MKHIFTILFVVLLVTANSQITQRCPVCPPKLTGVPDGWCLKDSSGFAVWQPCDSGTIGTGTPTQVTYFDGSGYITGDEGFTRTTLTTAIGNAVGDTFVWQGNGRELYTTFSVPQTVTAGSVITDNTNFASTAYNSRNGFWLGDHIYGTGYFMPKADGNNHQALITNGASQTAWQQISYSWLSDTPTIPTPITPNVPTYHFSNGITATNDTVVVLGGALTQATTLNLGAYSLSTTNNVFQSTIPISGGNMTLRLDTGNAGSYLGYFRSGSFGGSYFQVYPYDSTGATKIRWNAECRSTLDSAHRYGISGFDDNVNMYQFNPVGGRDVAIVRVQLHKTNIWTHDINGIGSIVEGDTSYLYLACRDSINQIIKTSSVWYYQDSTGHELKGSVQIQDGTQGAGKILTSDASGNATWQTLSGASGTGIPAYANNAAAFAALGAGKLYYTDVAGEYVLKLSH